MESMIQNTYGLIIALSWFTYMVVFVATLYKSFEFFKDIQEKPEFDDVSSVSSLKNLYLSSFILQVVAILLTLLVLIFAPMRSKK